MDDCEPNVEWYDVVELVRFELKNNNTSVIIEVIKRMEYIDMSATEVIKDILKDKNMSQVELAEKTNVTRQNLSNKMSRDNFSTLELVEIADALGMKLILKNISDDKEYLVDYPPDQKGKPKRKK